MANNCLVTKLKGAVDNDSLPEYGKVKIKINDGDVAPFYWGTTPGTMKVTGSLYFTNQAGDNLGKTMEISSTLSSYRISSGEGYLILPYKYTLPTYIDFSFLKSRVVFDIHDFAYSNFIHYNDTINLSETKCFGDISDIAFDHVFLIFKGCTDITGSIHKTIITLHEKNLSVKRLVLLSTNIDFDYNDCQYMPDLEALSGSKSSHGDFSKLGLTKVTSTYNYPADGITGSIEGFVANKISVGLTTGRFNLQFPAAYTALTYTGQPIASLVASGVIPDGGNTNFSWDAQGNITWSAS